MSFDQDDLERIVENQRDLLAQANELKRLIRTPSKATTIGYGRPNGLEDDEGGEFLTALFRARSQDHEEQVRGKADLEALGSRYTTAKATLGDSAAAGGNIVPPNVLAGLVEIAAAENIYRRLLTVQPVGFVSGVDVPAEDIIPARALVQAYGATKENVDWTASKYSATMYTLARIHDVGNQLLRNSKGAAQAEVISRLGRAFGLGEAYYILSGSGTSEPKGLLTSLAAASASFTTNKGSSTTTPATSIAGTVITALKALALRAVKADAIVLDAASYFTSLTDASTSFAVLGAIQAETTFTTDPNGGMRLFGIPYLYDPLMPANTGLVGQFKAATLFTGQEYRVDVSDQAGTRWDKNETGFRGEEEIGFVADPYVNSGKFQRLTGLNT